MDTSTPYAALPVRVTWENTDTAGYIHNSIVFRWFEQGELEWFRDLGIHWKSFPEHGFPRVHVEARFLQPLYFDDLCELRTRVGQVRAATYILRHEVHKAGRLAVQGQVTVCCVAVADGRPRVLPEHMREVLQGLCRPS